MKKIILKKTVVANLSKDGMNSLKGGVVVSWADYDCRTAQLIGTCQCKESDLTTCFVAQSCGLTCIK